MANIKISQLPTASAITSDDYMPIVENSLAQTQRADFSLLLNYVTSSTFNTLTVTDLQGTSADFTSLTGTLQGNANSATAVNTVFNNDNAVKYIPFVDTNGNQELKIDSGITYVPLSDSLIVNGNTTVAGNVGIGTSSPGAFSSGARNLVISDSTGPAGLTVHSSPTSEGRIYFADAVTTGVASREGQIVYYHNTNEMSFATATTEKVRIDSTGNVGIGTSIPTADLHLYRTSGDADLRVETTTAGQDSTVNLVCANSTTSTAHVKFYNGNNWFAGALLGSTNFAIGESSTYGTNTHFAIDTSGNSIFSGSVEVSGTLRADVEVAGNITAASYTLSAADYGKTLLFSSSATQDITCSSGLDVGYNVTVIQAGTGQLNFSGSGVTLVNRFAHTSSAGQYSAVSVIVLNGTQYLVVGDTA